MLKLLKLQSFVLFAILLFSCKKDLPLSNNERPDFAKGNYKTEKVIIVVSDGPRYSETWGNANHQYIPLLSKKLATDGCINTSFYNNGPTYTLPGHAALISGQYQNISNNGTVNPKYPSIFHLFSEQKGIESWMFAGKNKLKALGKYQGSKGNSLVKADMVSRKDTETYKAAIEVMKEKQPQLLLIQLSEPDKNGHGGNWQGYLDAIRMNDQLMADLLDFINEDPNYAGKTTVFITNDHGRHLDGWRDGFISHGDNCEGCKHILLYAFGPDFKKNFVTDLIRELIDIPVTTAELLGIKNVSSKGKVMWELFKNQAIS
jgi:predicted AlkP superfamily pyrophosphatase or phosphodiesterase